MNKVGIYYAFWTHDWNADFVPFISKVRTLGFDVLEVNSDTVANMTPAERARLRNAAADHGIALTACIGLPKKYDVASADAATRKLGVAFLVKQATALADTGIGELGGIVYGHWPGSLPPDRPDRRSFRDRSIASMKQVMKTARDVGVVFHMEVVNRFEQYLLNTAAEAVAYCLEVDSPNCKVLLDTFHMNIEEDSFAGAIRTAGKLLGHVHLGETNRRAPGRGKMPWDEIFGALKAIRFGGSVVMEPFLMPGGEVGRDIKVFRDLKGTLDLDAEAGRACRFVKKHLR